MGARRVRAADMTASDYGLPVEQADVIALLEAHVRGDEPAINAIFDTVDHYELLAAMVGCLIGELGEDRVRDVVVRWRQAQLD